MGEGDHIHCFISAPPKLSVADIVKYLKGISGRKLFEQFPEIRQKLWNGQLWNHSYYVGTIGEGMHTKIQRATVIRKIEGYRNSSVIFEQLLNLMSVTFVHNGQLTVVPFPFKYLREYIKAIWNK